MEGVKGGDVPLDYVAFKFLPQNKSYELFICHEGKSEKMALGSLEQIILQLPCLKDHFEHSREIFKLQPVESSRSARWFTRRTLDRFVAIVGASELLEHAIEIECELSQLEQARSFHLALYSEGDGECSLIYGDGNHPKRSTTEEKSTVLANSGDATKNELLRAMDVRLAALRDELTSTLDRAAGGSCSFQELADLLEFTQNFGSTNLKNLFLKYFALNQHSQPADDSGEKHLASPRMDAPYENANRTSLMKVPTINDSASNILNEVNYKANNASPAKIAQAERQISTDSEESSESSDESQPSAERSRTMIRSASPRRSASPMRRIQIGRSGSRRSTALTIKSLGFYPAREKIPTINGEHENSGEDEEATEMPKKKESSVRKFSVQDAINLFESKQKDSNLDFQTRRASSETGASFINTNKSVLRRWSAGLRTSSTSCIQENGSEGAALKDAKSSVENPEDEKPETSPPTIPQACPCLGSSPTDNADDAIDKDEKGYAKGEVTEFATSKVDETSEHEPTPAEWNQQREADLNQMLLKMIQSRPDKSRNQPRTGPNQVNKVLSSDKKDGFFEQYKGKRDARIQGENAMKGAEKTTKLKAVQADLESRKVAVAGKSGRSNVKQDRLGPSKNLVRNSSPSGLPKHEVSKPAASRKASPRPSPVSATRSSLSSAASPRTSITPTKLSTTPTSTSSSMSRKKNQPAASPTKTIPKTESSQKEQLPKTKKVSPSIGKTNLPSKDDKKQIVTRKNGPDSGGTRTAADDSAKSPAKPNLYKATKKSSVVPLESKPFLRKGMGIGPGSATVAKTKGAEPDDLFKAETDATQSADMEASSLMVDAPQSESGEMDQAKSDVLESGQNEYPKKLEDEKLEADMESPSRLYAGVNGYIKTGDRCIKTGTTFSAEAPTCLSRMPASEDVTDLIWVEMDQQDKPVMTEISPLKTSIAPLPARSPRVRHSLSQMLQADTGESEIVSEWGNAENPPALVYQKESPKGFKRLLKFGRKSRGGDSLATGWNGSPALSEGEDDDEESKGISNIDALLRESAQHMKGIGRHKAMLGESYDGSNSSRRSMEYNTNPELLAMTPTPPVWVTLAWPVPSPDKEEERSSLNNVAHSSPKLRQDQVSATTASTKGTRSFFSLSTFRSKGNETKLR